MDVAWKSHQSSRHSEQSSSRPTTQTCSVAAEMIHHRAKTPLTSNKILKETPREKARETPKGTPTEVLMKVLAVMSVILVFVQGLHLQFSALIGPREGGGPWGGRG